ncbi:ankyrin repeat domain-containing protein [Skeletonema marinoi]|uniref:Ankyrin repeat domain-containing protein n=1 Tax=Skeletonema marinoi TaxID=267567 RepID=A0AAD8Y4X3_9STRA|nr:ankyrin repeat domain-containing protein [Skeletonema marinoi]
MSDQNNNRQALLTAQLCDYCRSDALSEDALRDKINRLRVVDFDLPHDTTEEELLLHEVCDNERVTEGIIRCILGKITTAAMADDDDGKLPLHYVLWNDNVTLKMVQLLIDAAPESIMHQDNNGFMPIHQICGNYDLEEEKALKILKFLIDKSPQSARHADKDGDLPIHLACDGLRSPEFCRLLIDSYPGSERIKNSIGMLPLHVACQFGTVATVKYLLEIYPDGIHDESEDGNPIYFAIMRLRDRKDSEVAAKMVELLLSCNPNLTVATLKSGGGVVWESGYTPLRLACGNSHVTLNIVQRLVDAHPDSVRQENDEGWMPLHHLCDNDELDDMVSVEILRLLLEKCPESVRHVNNGGYLPIHIACGRGSRSPDFCRELIEAYPASARIAIANYECALPLHYACQSGTSATVKYFVDNYPEQIHVSDDDISYPIFCAVTGLKCIRNEDVKMQKDPAVAVEKVKILLACDDSILLQEYRGKVPLVYACRKTTNDFSFPSSSLNAAIKVIQLLYDAHPESLVDHKTILTRIRDRSDNREICVFLTTQFVYAEQMSGRHFMMTPDENGRLPLHTALLKNAALGSIKLLVKGNPNAIQTPDNSGVIPLHAACRHHESTSVIQHLIGFDENTLNAVDRLYNTPLHLACQGGKHETIALLVEEHDAVSVSKANAHKKLPIHLLFESDVDKSSIEYTQSIFLLFKAYPEAVNMASAEDEDCLSQTGLKRKFHDV